MNPVAYTEKVLSSFLRYQLTRYPFADAGLYLQTMIGREYESRRFTA